MSTQFSQHSQEQELHSNMVTSFFSSNGSRRLQVLGGNGKVGIEQAFCPEVHIFKIACSPCEIYEVKTVSLISFQFVFPADFNHLRGRGQRMCPGRTLVCLFGLYCFSLETEHSQCYLCSAVSPICLIPGQFLPSS